MSFSFERVLQQLTEGGKRELETPYLKRILDSYLKEIVKNESELNELGVQVLEGEIAEALNQRAAVVDHLEKHPEILETEIKAPILLAGIPRNGSTFFHRAFECDRRFKLPLDWEGTYVVPCPKEDELLTDPRVEAHQQILDILVDKDTQKLHHTSATGPEEDCHMFDPKSGHFILYLFMCDVARVRAEITFEDALEGIKFTKKQLQILAYHQGIGDRRFMLVNHTGTMALESKTLLEAYRQVFPDITVVANIRDPAVSMTSFCAFLRAFSGHRVSLDAEKHKKRIGENVLRLSESFNEGLKGYMGRCAAEGITPFHHLIDFNDLMKDPMGEFEKMYQSLGMSFDTTTRGAIEQYIKENPRYKRGSYSYNVAEFGLTKEQLDEASKDYKKIFEQ